MSSAQTCPLCGGPNQCEPARCGQLDVPCWCSAARFSPELLARLPPQARGTVCICAQCANAGADAGPPASTDPCKRGDSID